MVSGELFAIVAVFVVAIAVVVYWLMSGKFSRKSKIPADNTPPRVDDLQWPTKEPPEWERIVRGEKDS